MHKIREKILDREFNKQAIHRIVMPKHYLTFDDINRMQSFVRWAEYVLYRWGFLQMSEKGALYIHGVNSIFC